MSNKKFRAFSRFGNIALVNFSKGVKVAEKKKFAEKILGENPSIETVVEKSGNFKGRLRKMVTKHLAGVKNKEVLYKENNCAFRFDMDETYFSPRLSNERQEIAAKIKKGEEVLVLFAGVGPFSIVVAKNSNCKKVYSNELNRKANKYGQLNLELNKLKDRVELLPGDAKKVCEKLKADKKKFDVIVMPRPNLKDSFLKDALKVSKKGTRIYYYGFCKVDETKKLVEDLKEEAKEVKRNLRVVEVKPAGEIAPYKIRVRVDCVVTK